MNRFLAVALPKLKIKIYIDATPIFSNTGKISEFCQSIVVSERSLYLDVVDAGSGHLRAAGSVQQYSALPSFQGRSNKGAR